MILKPVAFDPVAYQDYLQSWETGTLNYALDGFSEALETTSPALLLKAYDIEQAKQGQKMSLDEWASSEYWRPGLDYTGEMTVELAKMQAEEFDKVRQRAIAGERATFGQEIVRFGMGVPGSVPDPINIIPVAGPLQKFGVFNNVIKSTLGRKAATTAFEGGFGAALLQPALAYTKQELQQDYTAGYAALDVLMGFGLGGVLGAGTHLIGTNANKFRSQLEVEKLIADAEVAIQRFDDEKPVNLTPPKPSDYAFPVFTADKPGENTIKVGDGQVAYKTKLVVRDMNDVVPSNQDNGDVTPGYPVEYQPRQERSSPELMQEVENHARKLDPALLGPSPQPQTGAPITYNNFVLSGNGRFMKIRRAAEKYPERYQAYRQVLEQSGFDTTGMERPVLVRELVVDDNRFDPVQFAEDSNDDLATQMTLAEVAKRDSRKLDPTLLRQIDGDLKNPANREVLTRMAQKMFRQNELNVLLTKGKINSEGLARIENAVMSAALYDNYSLINSALSKKNVELKNIFRSVKEIVPYLARLRGEMETGRIHPIDVQSPLIKALQETYATLDRENPITIQQLLDEIIGPQQADIFNPTRELAQLADGYDAKTVRFLQLFNAYRNAPLKISGVIRDLINRIDGLGDHSQMTLLGEMEPPKVGALIDEVIGRALQDAEVRSKVEGIRNSVAEEVGIKLTKNGEPYKSTPPELLDQYNARLDEAERSIREESPIPGPFAAQDDVSYAVANEEVYNTFDEMPKEKTPDELDLIEQQVDRELDGMRDSLTEEDLAALRDADEEYQAIEKLTENREDITGCIMRHS